MKLNAGHIAQVEMQTDFKVTRQVDVAQSNLRDLHGDHTYFDDGEIVVYWSGAANQNGKAKELVATQVATRDDFQANLFIPHPALILPVSVVVG